MSVAKHVEITAQSDESFEDAVKKGVRKAGETVKNIQSAWVKDQQALVKDGKVHAYRVNMRVTFVLD